MKNSCIFNSRNSNLTLCVTINLNVGQVIVTRCFKGGSIYFMNIQ